MIGILGRLLTTSFEDWWAIVWSSDERWRFVSWRGGDELEDAGEVSDWRCGHALYRKLSVVALIARHFLEDFDTLSPC